MKKLTRERVVPIFCECLLANLRRDGLRGAILSEICQKQEKAREPLLAGIEQLVDQVFFDAAVST